MSGETIDKNKDPLYDIFHSKQKEDEITHPWDSDLKDLPLHEESDKYYIGLDKYIGTQIEFMDNEGIPILPSVRSRKRDNNGNWIGIKNQNPILDSTIFVVAYEGWNVDEYNTNKITEAIYSELDDEDFDTSILEKIVDHRKSETSINIDKDFDTMSNGIKSPVITTKGWSMKIRWADNSFDWLPPS